MLEKIRVLDKFRKGITKYEKERRKDILIWGGYTDKNSVILDMGSKGNNEWEDTLDKFLKSNMIGNVIGVDAVKGNGVDMILNLNEFPYSVDENSVDLIIAGEVIEHLSEPYKFLLECHRILKPGKRMIITTPNMTSITYILGILHNAKDGSYGHCHAWNIELFDTLLSRTKFKVLYKKLTNGLASWDVPIELFTNVFPVFKTGMFYVLEKVKE